MPIYEYISENPDDPGQSCPVCRRGFELRRPVDRAPLEKCLVCKHPVRKVISRVNVPEITKPLSVSGQMKQHTMFIRARSLFIFLYFFFI